MPSICSSAAANISLASDIMITSFQILQLWHTKTWHYKCVCLIIQVSKKHHPLHCNEEFAFDHKEREDLAWDNDTNLPGFVCVLEWSEFQNDSQRRHIQLMAYNISAEASRTLPKRQIPEHPGITIPNSFHISRTDTFIKWLWWIRDIVNRPNRPPSYLLRFFAYFDFHSTNEWI